jgi:hypothetical protein
VELCVLTCNGRGRLESILIFVKALKGCLASHNLSVQWTMLEDHAVKRIYLMSVGGSWTQERDGREGSIRFGHDVLLSLGVHGSGVVVVRARRTWPTQECNHFST